MLISFPCARCGGKLEIDAAGVGTRVGCPHCGKPIEVPRLKPGPGATVGGFKILRSIGAGGMGEVYLARQLSLDRDVALKIFPPDLAEDKERVRRFLNEVRLLARLEHPNIVTAHEAGEDAGVLFMAMAYVNGEPLDRLLERGGPLPEKRALQIVRKIAAALAYAWNEHRLLHRDVKPSNILLDAHGEPKLADLGLSRRADRRPAEGTEDEILGTPNYMSPEQVAGGELDGRSDMYSLGATLYHMLTGQLPFQAGSVMETLHKQISEMLPDPRVFAPSISDPCVRLLEIMLAKTPAERHGTWESLIGDLDRVKARKMPMRRPVAKGASVLLRAKDEASLAEIRRLRVSAAQIQQMQKAATSTVTRRRPEPFPVGVAVAVALVVALGGFAAWGVARLRRDAARPPATPPAAPPDGTAGRAAAEREAARATEWRALRAAAEAVPFADDALLGRIEAFRVSVRGTALESEAAELGRRLRERRHAAVQQAAAALRTAVERVAGESGFEAALRFAEAYDGPFAAELDAHRRELAAEQRARIETRERARADAARAAFETLRTELCAAALRQDAAAARAAAERAAPLLADDAARAAADRMRALAEHAARLNEVVMESFRPEIGRTIALGLAGGVETWEIFGLAGSRLSLRRPAGPGFVERKAGPEDLAPAEKYKRTGPEGAPETELLRGLVALGSGRTDVARRHFEAMGEPLGPALAAHVDLVIARSLDAAARRALEPIVRLARQALDERPPDEIAAAIRRTGFTPGEVAAIRPMVAPYRQQHAAAAFTRDAAALLAALENVHTVPREVDRAAIDAALEALRRANPPVERILHAVTLRPDGVQLVLVGNPGVTNLSALAVLPLIRLNVAGGAVSDLGPLRGMPLQSIDLSGCPVADLGPLAGAPLTEANLEACPVENLAGLKGAPLADLNLRRTRVRSLAPLAGAPLKRLLLDDTPVESLDPLAGAPLEELSARGASKISSLAALQGLPLKKLALTGVSIADLRPLKGLPLTELHVGSTGVTDLEPLRGLPLLSLTISHTRAADLGPLSGMPLRRLEASNLPELRDLAPLRGMPLNYLWINGSSVTDLAPIAAAPLIQLDLRQSPVDSLEPLRGSPVEILFLDGCSALRNLQPLLEMRRLATLTMPDAGPRPILRRIPSLREVGPNPDQLRPVAEFIGDGGA